MLPREWLDSVVVPIYKKSMRCDPLNYRPISLTSVPCKVLERLIAKHLMQYLDTNSLLSNHQYGFRSKHSTCDQLIITYNDITKFVDSGCIVDLVFFDFTKAFDKVSHGVLLGKLGDIGVCPQILFWISQFLCERSMKVVISGRPSNSRRVTSGVPQGSVLGPLLFLIYINHAVSHLHCYYKIFADDIKLYLTCRSGELSVAEVNLQQNVDTLIGTSESWGLSMNVSKCVCIRFCSRSHAIPYEGNSPYHINNEYIQFALSHPDLGITIDRSLKFHSHIKRIVNTCNGLITNLLGSTLCRDPAFMMNIFKSYIRPQLEYSSSLWNLGFLGDTRSLESVQRRWTREVRDMGDISYQNRLQSLNLFSFQGRLLRSDMILTWKIFNGKCAISPEQVFIMDNSITRGHRFKIFLPRVNLEICRRFFPVRVVQTWNSLGDDTVSCDTLNGFKSLLHRDLGERLYEFLD